MSLAPAPFGRVLTAMVTAFKDDGSIDFDAVARTATHLADHGHDGIVVSGTTGESPTTTTAEDGDILRTVIDAVGDRVKVVAGVGTNDTRHTIELIRQAERVGADGALLVTPYYNKPTQDGVIAHVDAVTAASDLPVILYDIPGRTGIAIAPDTYRRVAGNPKIVAVKDAVGDIERGARLTVETGLAWYSGDDALNLAWLTHGAVGVISVVGHLAGKQYAAMVDAVDRGDLDTALTIYRSLIPLVDVVMTRVQGAMMAKAGLQLLGILPNRHVRLPLVPAPEELVGELKSALDKLS